MQGGCVRFGVSAVKAVAGVAVIAIVAATVFFIATNPYFEIRSIEVRGPVESAGLQEVTRVVEANLRGNILTADIDALRDSLEALSWIRSARVSRLWPDSLYIHVVRHNAIAIWEDGRLVSEEGMLFSSNDEPIERLVQLPLFSGDPQYVGQAVQYLIRFESEAKKVNARVKALKVTFRGSWSVVLESEEFNAMEIELGRALTQGGPVSRLRQVVTNLERVREMLRGYPERIDARYRNAFAAQIPQEAQKLLKDSEQNAKPGKT